MDYRLVLDFGNTALKAHLFRNGEPYEQAILDAPTKEEILAFSGNKPVSSAILASVVNHPATLKQDLAPYFPLLILDMETALPIRNRYATPASLGYDRVAAAVGGWQLFPGSPVLAIVTGTCITYNLVDGNGDFRGGAISPGLHMRLLAMHEYTQKLPLVPLEGDHTLPGDTTEISMRSGALDGAVFEIEGMMRTFSKQFPGLETVLGGGDSAVLAEALKNGIFARPNLVAEGLYRILDHHVANRLI